MTASGRGLDPASIKPPDAVAALRSFPRRWRGALALVAEEPGAEELTRRRAGSSWSALEHAWYVAELLDRTQDQVARIRAGERPHLSDGDPRPRVEEAVEGDGDLEAALARIDERAPALARALEALAPDDWLRRGELDRAEVSLLALVQGTVASAAGHLRSAEQALRAAKGR